jgi:calcium-dependent protein kinase
VEELRDALAVNSRLPMDELQQMMQDIDMNASGAIDYEEFLAATLHASKIASDEHLQRAFLEFDTDGSGGHQCGTSSHQDCNATFHHICFNTVR